MEKSLSTDPNTTLFTLGPVRYILCGQTEAVTFLWHMCRSEQVYKQSIRPSKLMLKNIKAGPLYFTNVCMHAHLLWPAYTMLGWFKPTEKYLEQNRFTMFTSWVLLCELSVTPHQICRLTKDSHF